ncbi:Transcription factor Adf-1 [Operophtera brumata]|uniref:Transcription factor Adf-1 n=1 Tax=Operophtera brumata TaxID=104452 RepID=A0A0L7LIC2_OPEBR|nr:Transcription factor Adf-1 [Operophtera brumata]
MPPTFFSKNVDLKLIELVKENPVLYNPRHPKYTDSDTREVTWQKIGDSLSRPGEYLHTCVMIDDNLSFNSESDMLEVKPTLTFRKRNEDASTSREFESSSTSYQELNNSDPMDVFLMTIGSTLRKFSPLYLNQAKSKIFQIVQDFELKQIL